MGYNLARFLVLLAWIDGGLVTSDAVTQNRRYPPKENPHSVPRLSSSVAPYSRAMSPTTLHPEVPVRLANGTSECSGRVELLLHGAWRPLCREFWDGKEADVVCRQTGCGRSQSTRGGGAVWSPGPFWVVLMNCTGREDDWRDCPGHALPAYEPCDRNLTAVVTCTEHKEVRLAGGGSRCAGRVEIHSHGTWGTICDDSWGRGTASVVCRQLGCGEALSATNGSSFGQGQGPIYLDEVRCRGDEAYLWNCASEPWGQHDCGHKEDAGVECSGHREVELSGGPDRCSGLVRIRDWGTWGSLCDLGWDLAMAHRVCHYLGCGNATGLGRAQPLGVGGRTWAGECGGANAQVPACFRSVPPQDCEGRERVSVTCSGSAYLTDLPSNVSINVITTVPARTDEIQTRGSKVYLLIIGMLVLLLLILSILFVANYFNMRRRMVMQLSQPGRGDRDIETNDYREMSPTPSINSKPPTRTVPVPAAGDLDSPDEDYEDYNSFAPQHALNFSTFKYSVRNQSQQRDPVSNIPMTIPEAQTGSNDRGRRLEVPYSRSVNNNSSSEDEGFQAASANSVRRPSKPKSQRWKQHPAYKQSTDSSSTSSCEWYENTTKLDSQTQPQPELLAVPQHNEFQSSTSTLPVEEYENVQDDQQNVPDPAAWAAPVPVASEAGQQDAGDSTESDYDDIETYFPR